MSWALIGSKDPSEPTCFIQLQAKRASEKILWFWIHKIKPLYFVHFVGVVIGRYDRYTKREDFIFACNKEGSRQSRDNLFFIMQYENSWYILILLCCAGCSTFLWPFLYRKVSPFVFRFWILGKIVFVGRRMKYSTVLLIVINIIKKWVNFDGF